MMEIQIRIHLAVQENYFDSRQQTWKSFLPYYFVMNKFNYQRYGTFYVGTLDNINDIYPGNKELLSRQVVSVQSQDRYPLKTAID